MLWEHSDSRSAAEINDAPFASLNRFLEAPVFYWLQESMCIHIARRSVLWCSFALSSCINGTAWPDLHPKLTECKKNFEKLSKNSFFFFQLLTKLCK